MLEDCFDRKFKVSFMGGEPLLKEGFEKPIENIKKRFLKINLNITTHGILLKGNNIKGNVSLDTFNSSILLCPEHIRYGKVDGQNYFNRGIKLFSKL